MKTNNNNGSKWWKPNKKFYWTVKISASPKMEQITTGKNQLAKIRYCINNVLTLISIGILGNLLSGTDVDKYQHSILSCFSIYL